MNSKFSKWIKWLKTIETEIYHLVVDKDIFWSVQEMIRKNINIQKPSSFYRYLGDTYVSHALIGIRRQIKKGSQSISFNRLLHEIAQNPEILSKKYFKSLYSGSVLEELGQADKDFNQFCGKNPNHISSVMVEKDIQLLVKYSKKCEDFADKRIAHIDTNDPKYPLTFEDMDNCIDYLDKLYCKYHLIFHAESMETLMPAYQYDWKAIFDDPWRTLEN